MHPYVKGLLLAAGVFVGILVAGYVVFLGMLFIAFSSGASGF